MHLVKESLRSGGPVALGPFDLVRPLGKGGMAEVWLATHRSDGDRVAVKVLTGERAREEAFIRALKNEIHNVARLHHPGIILVFDTGEVDAEAERQSGGRLVAGSPWFAMELASHGALSPKRLPLPWPTTRMLLLSLLDALSHAHARGVIHRDIKPGNILVCAPEDPRPGLKLTDFGIAAPLSEGIDESAEEGRLSGTPRYMAPEQFRAKWRDFGPWTDLYALGCIAFQLATGKTPFAGDALKLAVSHCHDAPPAPTPANDDYPEGFEAWVLRLLEKDPLARFACAADAAWALLRLRAPGVEDEITVVSGWEEALRSLKPRLFSEIDQTAAATGDGLQGLAGSRSSDDDGAAPAEDSDAEGSGPGIESGSAPPSLLDDAPTGLHTAVDRPRDKRSSTGLSSSGTSVFARLPTLQARKRRRPEPGLVSSLSDASIPIDQPSTRSGDVDPFEMPEHSVAPTATITHMMEVDDDDRAYPPVGATSSSERRRRPAAADDGAPIDTTIAPNVPWTELAAMSPKGLATVTGRAVSDEKRRQREREQHDEAKLAPRLPPPMPPTWRRPGPHAPSRHLHGAGLGLYGLRQIPLIDRDAERDRVWDTLREVRDGGGARVVILRGPTGIGKSRLAEWLVERTVEVGAALAVRAGHGPGGGPLDGLPGLIALNARTLGLKRRELLKRLFEVVRRQGLEDADEALALGELLHPGGDGDDRVRLGSARERHALVLRYLERLAVDRPAVAWLDDVQWGADAIAFARMVVDDRHGRQVPLMVVLSVNDEEIAARPIEAEALEELARQPATVTIRLPNLPDDDHLRLVEELLGLEPGFAAQVAARTAGNPLFAVTLVGDFVMRGALELTREGFALRRDASAELPDDLHQVWDERLARVFERMPPGSRHALELGAVLGSAGDDGEWQAACDEAGVELPLKLIDELLVGRLLVPDEGGLHFAHAMLRESVLRTAAEERRLAGCHLAAARMLEKRYGLGRRGMAARIGHHLALGGALEEAVPKLLTAADEAARTLGYAQAHALLAEREALLDRLNLDEDDPRRAEGWAAKASVLADEGRYDEALMWSGLVEQHEANLRYEHVLPVALRVTALVALRQTRWDEASGRYAIARDAAERAGDRGCVIECLNGIADAEYYQGRLARSGDVLAEAFALCQQGGDEAAMAFCLWNSAYVALWSGEVEQARELLLRQQKLARRAGHRSMIANGRNALGDVARVSGHYDEAEKHYDEALKLMEAIGSGKRRTVRANLAVNALSRGRMERAVQLVEELLPEVDKAGEAVLSATCHGVLAAHAAANRDWPACDRHFAALVRPRRDSGLVDGEHAVLCEIIGDHARAQADDERAAEAYHCACDIWDALGRRDRVVSVEKALGTLGTRPVLRRPQR